MKDLYYCYIIDQVCWNRERTKGDKVRCCVLARNSQEASQLAGDDDIHEIELMQRIGPVVAGMKELCDSYLSDSTLKQQIITDYKNG